MSVNTDASTQPPIHTVINTNHNVRRILLRENVLCLWLSGRLDEGTQPLTNEIKEVCVYSDHVDTALHRPSLLTSVYRVCESSVGRNTDPEWSRRRCILYLVRWRCSLNTERSWRSGQRQTGSIIGFVCSHQALCFVLHGFMLGTERTLDLRAFAGCGENSPAVVSISVFIHGESPG